MTKTTANGSEGVRVYIDEKGRCWPDVAEYYVKNGTAFTDQQLADRDRRLLEEGFEAARLMQGDDACGYFKIRGYAYNDFAAFLKSRSGG